MNGFHLERLAKHRREFIDIFETVEAYIKKFIVFQSDDEAIVITNWIVHTYLLHLFDYTPYLHIFSATKQCGKTLLMGIINALSNQSQMLINFSEPIFRYIDKAEPTLCIDEVDRWDSESKEAIWGIINSGFLRQGGSVMRVQGQSHEPVLFKTFCAKVIAGIDRNSIPDTVQDRSIPIELVRKLQSEPVTRFRHREQVKYQEEIISMLEPLTEYSNDWESQDILFDDVHENALFETYKDEILNDRALDIVEPLVVVASMGTLDWLEKTIRACINLTKREDQEDSNLDLEILKVCNQVRMLNVGSKHIFTDDLITAIHQFKESELAHMNGWGIDPSYLAKRLKVFGIKPTKVRIGTESKRGYVWRDFIDPVQRWLTTPSDEEELIEEEPVIEVEQVDLF